MDNLKDYLQKPIMATILEDRRMGLTVTGALVLQGSLLALDLPGWPCPFRHGLGVPCPGCGLSRAIMALFRGEWQLALDFHAFAPLILLALLVIVSASFLPQRQRVWFIGQVERLERHTGLSAIVLLGIVGYWLIRLSVFHETYIGLIMG